MQGQAPRPRAAAHPPFRLPRRDDRHLGAVFPLSSGDTLAVMVVCATDGSGQAQAQWNRLPRGGTDWPGPETVQFAAQLAAPASQLVRPVLVQAGGQPRILWALDFGGVCWIEQAGAGVMTGFSQALVTALTGDGDRVALAMEPDESGHCDIRVARTGTDDWQIVGGGPLACQPWELVTELAIFANHLYAAKSNATDGLSVWRAPLADQGNWECVIDRGAWRYGASPIVSAMACVNGRLLIGATGADRSELRIGDEYPEILAIAEDGSWTLVSGQDRFTPRGLLKARFPSGPSTSAMAGMAIGGFQPTNDGVLVWLKPLDAEREIAQVLHLSEADGTWTIVQNLTVGDADLTSFAWTESNGCIATTVTDVLMAGTGKRANLTAVQTFA